MKRKKTRCSKKLQKSELGWMDFAHHRIWYYDAYRDEVCVDDVAIPDVIPAFDEKNESLELTPYEILKMELVYAPKEDLKELPKPIADFVKKRAKKKAKKQGGAENAGKTNEATDTAQR